MTDAKPGGAAPAEVAEAMNEVLRAEAAAAQAVAECERRAEQMVRDAQARAQHLIGRADRRITAIQMRCNHRIDSVVRAMEQEQTPQDGAGQPAALGPDVIEAVVAALAAELTSGEHENGQQPAASP